MSLKFGSTWENRECIYCFIKGTEEKKEETLTLIPLDKPYMNLWMHKSCKRKFKTYSEVLSFLQENKEIWYNEE